MILSWDNPLELSQGGDPVYKHPEYGRCSGSGKILTPLSEFKVEDIQLVREGA